MSKLFLKFLLPSPFSLFLFLLMFSLLFFFFFFLFYIYLLGQLIRYIVLLGFISLGVQNYFCSSGGEWEGSVNGVSIYIYLVSLISRMHLGLVPPFCKIYLALD